MTTMQVWPGATELGVEELETGLLLEAVFQRWGHDFRAYDRAALRRKLAAAARMQGAATLSGLQEKVLHDAGAAAALLRALSVAPCALFDDADHVRRLRAVLAPALRGWAVPKVWIAECAGVGAAWTLAIALAEEGVADKLEIHATLANEELVGAMADAWLPVAALGAAQAGYAASGGRSALAPHFDIRDGQARLRPDLLRRITWSQYSLVTDASFNEFQAIVCRGVLGDVGPLLRQRVLRLCHDSLARFGMLALDGPLVGTDAWAGMYQGIVGARGWYKRVG